MSTQDEVQYTPATERKKESKQQRKLDRNIEAFMNDLYKKIKHGTNEKAQTQKLLSRLKNDKEKAKVLAPYVCDRDEMSLLHLAAIYHDDETVIKELVEICPELLTKKRSGEYKGQTALHIAILKKNFKGAKVIIESVKKRLGELQTEESKQSPIYLKLQEQFKTQLEDLKKMIYAKATGIIFKNTKMMGELPLTIAALNFDEEMIKLLLDNGAKIRKRNSQGDTVFHTLVRYAQVYPDDLEHVKKNMQTLNCLLSKKVSKLDVVDQIKEHNMAVWLKKNKEGLTVLQLAALLEQPEIFEFIMDLKDVYRIQDKTDGLFESTRYDITEIDSVTHIQWRSPTVTGTKVTPISGVPKQSASSQKVQDLISVSNKKDKKSSSTSAQDKHKPLTILSREPRSPSVLEIICETKTLEKAFQIMNLPVVQNVIARKWRKYLPLFFLSLIVHIILMALVTTQTILKAQLIFVSTSTNAAPSSVVTKQSFVSGTSIFLFVFGVILITLEAVRIWHREPMCLALHHHNGLYRVQLVVLALSMMGDSIWYWVKRNDNNYFLILALVIGWWYFTFYLRPFKKFSFFTVMMRKVLFGDVLRFSTMIIIDLLAFSFAMYATFLPSPGGLPDEFRHLGVTLMTMFKLLLGLSDLSVLYDAPQDWVAVILFVTFTLMTYILMVNALIAMMSNTCSMVTTTRVEQWQLQRLSVILMIEGMLPLSWRLNSSDMQISSPGHILQTKEALREGRFFLKAKGKYFENTVMMGGLPLSVAVLTFNMDVVKTLVKYGACLYAKNHKGDTVFHSLVHFAAVFPDKIDHVTNIMKDLNEYMIKKPLKQHSRSMDVWYEKDKDDLTVLQLSVKLAQPEIFKTLLALENVYCYADKQDGLFDSKMYDVTVIDTVALQEWRVKTDERHNAISPMICGTEDKNSTVTSYGKEPCLCHTKSVEPAPRKLFLRKRWPSVIELICENEQVLKIFEILDVDVVRLVVDKKWQKVKNWFISWFVAHLSFMIYLSVYAGYKAEYYRECGGIVTGTAGSNSTCVYSNEKKNYLLASAGLIIAYSLVHLFLEARRFWYRQPIGFKLIHHNGFYRLLLVGCFSLLIADSFWFYATHPHNNILVVLALILGWWYMTFFLRPLKKFSFFAVMLRKVLIGDVLRFIIIILLELLAFSLAMYIIFLPSPDGPPEAFDGWATVMTMFQVLLGLTDLNILDTLRASSVPWLSIALFVFFIILTYILMLNALIAMMSNTCTLVAENRKKQTELQKLSVALYMESMIPFKKFVISDIKEVQRGYSYPNPEELTEGRSYLKAKTLQTFTEESRMSTNKMKEIVQTVVNKEITQFKAPNKKILRLNETLSKLSETLERSVLQTQNDSHNQRGTNTQAEDLHTTLSGNDSHNQRGTNTQAEDLHTTLSGNDSHNQRGTNTQAEDLHNTLLEVQDVYIFK